MSLLGVLYSVAAILCVGLALAHSYLGERYILMRLFRRAEIPKLFGSTEFTTRTLRFAWHLTSVAWLGAGALFFLLARGPLTSAAVAAVLAGVFFIHAGVTLFASRGRHFAWPLFLIIGIIAFYGVTA